MEANPNEPDKRTLYGEFQRTARWQDNLRRKLLHKSLDIAEGDEMDVQVSNRKGLGLPELLVLAAIAWAAAYYLKPPADQPAETPPPPPAAVSPTGSAEDLDTFLEFAD